ncbi:MAG: sulfotransferase [Actinomycetota bacterium]|nr:sulfotransferase [Actinomycetota bacterium]
MAPTDAPRVHQPVIVLGAPRSGTTLLASILSAHSQVRVIGEPRLVWRYGNDGRSDQLRAEHATPRVIDHIHRNFATALADGHGTKLVEKTPANALRPRFVDAVFPDARYVHITRDGWGAVPSMRTFWERRAGGVDAKQATKLRRRLREARLSQVPFYVGEVAARLFPRSAPGRRTPLYGPRLAGLQAMADELGRLETSAMQWRACVEAAASFGRSLPADRYLEVKLESLDRWVMATIVEFCGLAPEEAVAARFDECYRIDAASRQAPLTDGERDLVAPWVTAANQWLGYDAHPAGTAGT